jgi:hypothetical protein
MTLYLRLQRLAQFALVTGLASGALAGCGLFGNNQEGGAGTRYNFTATSKNAIKSGSVSTSARLDPSLAASSAPASCTDNLCFTPITLTGKYYGIGLMMQVEGNGMNAYFGQDSWSSISGTSPQYEFNATTPITHTGNLTCCAGSGTFSSNSYFSDVLYLFGSLDSTFTVSTTTGASGTALGTHTVRFVLSDDAVTLAKRGDIFYKDTDGQFKWIDNSTGNLSLTRPTTPVTMNTEVSNWVNPYDSTKGQQHIPVISSSIADPPSGKHSVSEDSLKASGKSYVFDFPSSGLMFFPTVLKTDAAILSSRLALLQRVHIQGLPHSGYPSGSALATTSLTIISP